MSTLDLGYMGHSFRTPAKSVKLSKSRAFNDENNARFYPGTAKKSNRTKQMTQRGLLVNKPIDHDWSPRRPNDSKGTISVNPLSEITNKTPYPRKNREITLSKTLELLDINDQNPEVTSSCRRLSSTRKTARLPNPVHKNPKTPISGNPWDVSDGSMDIFPPDAQPVPLEDEDDVEYCPGAPSGEVHDHGLDLELPDYTLARHLLNNTVGDGIIEPVYEVDLVFEAYELASPQLIEESDLLIRDFFGKDKSADLAQDGKPSVVSSTQARAKAPVCHSRIPSLSKQYASTTMVKRDSSNVRHAHASTMPSRLTKKSDGSKVHTHIPTWLPNKASSEVKNPQLIIPVDIVPELLTDPFEAEDVYFEL